MLNLAVHAIIPLKELRTMMYAFPAFYGAIGESIGAWGQGVTLAIEPEYDVWKLSTNWCNLSLTINRPTASNSCWAIFYSKL